MVPECPERRRQANQICEGCVMDQIGDYMTSSWIVGILAASVGAAVVGAFATWVFHEFFTILEEDEKGADR